MITKIQPKQWVHKMDDKKKKRVQKEGQIVKGWGFSHKPSRAVWLKTVDQGYTRRASLSMGLFDIPRDTVDDGIEVVADVGCGPRGGVFAARQWPTMYGVDPVWTLYENNDVIALRSKRVFVIEEYAQDFTLPEPANLIFSINALNHGGDINLSIKNIMHNLAKDGTFFLHVHLRPPKNLDGGHPMDLSEGEMREVVAPYQVVSTKVYTSDPTRRRGGHPSFVSTLKNKG